MSLRTATTTAQGTTMSTTTTNESPVRNATGARALAQREVKRHQENLLTSCLQAVGHLERFAAEARREIEKARDGSSSTVMELPGQILAKSAWGAANAATELQRASTFLAAYSAAVARLQAANDEG
jgi:hypothetical protein